MLFKIVKRFEQTPSAYSIHLVPPGGMFSFRPGQFVIITAQIDNKPVKRSYSIASCPGIGYIEITIKLKPGGLMSQHLKCLPIGSEVSIDGPFGKFFLEEDKKIVFIAGGAGIAPIMSMIRSLPKKELTLFYSCKTQEELIYRKELEEMPSLRKHFTLTAQDWEGCVGRIDGVLISKNSDLSSTFYICGPPEMVNHVAATLEALGVEDKRIRKEAW